MKVCQLLPTNSSGGLLKHYVELTNSLGRRTETVAICPEGIGHLIDRRVRHRPLINRSWRGNPFFTLKLLKLLRQEKPDIVHAHGNTAVLHLGRLRKFINASCVGTIHWNLKKERERKLFRKLDGVIGVSDEVLKGIDNPRAKVIHNGVPTTPSQRTAEDIRSQYRIPDTRPVAIAIGRLVKTKGFDVLLHAWKGIDGTLLLVGNGPQKQALEDLASELGISERVFFTGTIDDATSLFPAVDLVIVSSLKEGFGYVIAEALVHKKPIVSTSVTFARQRLPASLLAEPGSATDLHRLISETITNAEGVSHDLSELYDWAHANLSLDAMTDNIIGYYKDLLEQ